MIISGIERKNGEIERKKSRGLTSSFFVIFMIFIVAETVDCNMTARHWAYIEMTGDKNIAINIEIVAPAIKLFKLSFSSPKLFNIEPATWFNDIGKIAIQDKLSMLSAFSFLNIP